MRPRPRLRPQRQLLLAFMAVAVMSVLTLGWLGWRLLAQDAALETQRRQERLEQAADRALALMQRTLSDLQARAAAGRIDAVTSETLTQISVDAGTSLTIRSGMVPFVPARQEQPFPPSSVFAKGEAYEFAQQNLVEAAAEVQPTGNGRRCDHARRRPGAPCASRAQAWKHPAGPAGLRPARRPRGRRCGATGRPGRAGWPCGHAGSRGRRQCAAVRSAGIAH